MPLLCSPASIITTLHSIDDTAGGTFNRRFDVIFSEDCRDADGRLKNTRRGDPGIQCVISYLESIHWESAGIALDLPGIKLTRVVDELERLWYVLLAPGVSPLTPLRSKSSVSGRGAKQPVAASGPSGDTDNHEPKATNAAADPKSRGPEWETCMDSR
jgi:hypothetical protein